MWCLGQLPASTLKFFIPVPVPSIYHRSRSLLQKSVWLEVTPGSLKISCNSGSPIGQSFPTMQDRKKRFWDPTQGDETSKFLDLSMIYRDQKMQCWRWKSVPIESWSLNMFPPVIYSGLQSGNTHRERDVYIYIYLCTYTHMDICKYIYIYIHLFIYLSKDIDISY